MILDIILDALVYILAIYGLIEIIKTIYYIMKFTNLNEDGIYIIIGVKNQEKNIEGIVRSILFKIMYGKEEKIKKVILADLDSTDKTSKKLKKLKKENDFLEVTNWKKCKDIIDLVDENQEKILIIKIACARIIFVKRRFSGGTKINMNYYNEEISNVEKTLNTNISMRIKK